MSTSSDRDRRGWSQGLGRLVAGGLREPIVHFLLVGASVFALSSLWGTPSDSRVVQVRTNQIEALRRGFELRRGRSPTPVEERALVERHIDDEVMVREALALGLDRDDVVIRRRLAQKMAFITQDLHPAKEPSDSELERYLAQHAKRYAEPARVTFTHVFVQREGGNTERELRQLQHALEAGDDPALRGDPFISGESFIHRSEPELAAVFGPTFARAAMELVPGRWTSVESTYGLHVVRVGEREAERTPVLSEIRQRVRRDWLRDAMAETDRQERARLRARYRIEIEDGS